MPDLFMYIYFRAWHIFMLPLQIYHEIVAFIEFNFVDSRQVIDTGIILCTEIPFGNIEAG